MSIDGKQNRTMCRWNAYFGQPLVVDELLFKTDFRNGVVAGFGAVRRELLLEVDALRRLHPGNPRLQRFTDEDRVVVSEPPGDLAAAWLEIPESTAMIIPPGADEQRPFQPHWP